ncbi:hypothetical protein F949_02423 [Acinetobacter junii NIPH 182]|uniref:hypothetical protein n=1 Tax=Acinetobacter junii TaxID=40215 RepID=UPI0002D0B3BF|nr:hypothetical protein [Acinetobacter junii]ENV62768.1 hypothetical protein F949_02423 [Acinetobacter junii NIPH 182]
MATWQFTVCLIPKSVFDTNEKEVFPFYDEDENYDVSFTWKNININVVKDEIQKYYPISKSWHKDLISFGYEKSTDVQMWYTKGKLENIQFRIDMRGNFIVDIEHIVNIAQTIYCVFFIPSQKCIADANMVEIIDYAKKSEAYLLQDSKQSPSIEGK